VTEPYDQDRLIRILFDAVADDDALAAGLAEVGGQLGAFSGQALVIRAGTGELLANHFYGPEGVEMERSFEAYERDWRSVDPRFAAAMRSPSTVLSDVAVVEPAVFERSAMYNELLLPAGARYTLFGNFFAGPDLVIAPAFLRRPAVGAYQRAEVERLTALVPHLVRALTLHEMFRGVQAENRDLRRALDTVPTAVLLLDAAGKVLCANAQAEEILAAKQGLGTRQGVLTAQRPSDAKLLASAIEEAASLGKAWQPSAPAPRAPNVTIARERGAPLGVALHPMSPRNASRHFGASYARVLAVIHDPERVVYLDAELVARLHGFTPTEAELAVALAAGRSLTNFAAERGCSEQTARTHMKHIFAKTGLTRQSDLVRVLLTGAAAHRMR
jgi:DNA-binding CsgD family transcriptional regulator/PAS domain-containing protein